MFDIAGTVELGTICPGTGTWNRLQDGIPTSRASAMDSFGNQPRPAWPAQCLVKEKDYWSSVLTDKRGSDSVIMRGSYKLQITHKAHGPVPGSVLSLTRD